MAETKLAAVSEDEVKKMVTSIYEGALVKILKETYHKDGGAGLAKLVVILTIALDVIKDGMQATWMDDETAEAVKEMANTIEFVPGGPQGFRVTSAFVVQTPNLDKPGEA